MLTYYCKKLLYICAQIHSQHPSTHHPILLQRCSCSFIIIIIIASRLSHFYIVCLCFVFVFIFCSCVCNVVVLKQQQQRSQQQQHKNMFTVFFFGVLLFVHLFKKQNISTNKNSMFKYRPNYMGNVWANNIDIY